MKIADVLANYPDDYNIKIGSADGNGYFYCGTVADWNENCDAYSVAMKAHVLERYNNAFNSCQKSIKLFCENTIKASKDHKTITEDYILSVENYFERIGKMVTTKNNAKKRMDLYVPIGDREVVEYFEADLAVEFPECLIILIKGSESGKFWDNTEVTDCHLGFNQAAEKALAAIGADD